MLILFLLMQNVKEFSLDGGMSLHFNVVLAVLLLT